MKTSSGPESVRQRLGRFAISAIVAGVGLSALAWPAEAEVVYTKVNVQIPANSSFNLDLNNDGVADFTISTSYRSDHPGMFSESDVETPASGNGADGSPPARLIQGDEGAQIGPSQTFYGGTGTVASLVDQRANGGQCVASGNWIRKGCCNNCVGRSGYLGLMLQINGETHYGWALLSVNLAGPVVTLNGYAYETTANMPIYAGQTTEAHFKITTSPASASVSPGQPTTSTLTLTPVYEFSDTVMLSCRVPSGKGLSCEVSPSSVILNGTSSATATFSINTSSSTPAGTYKINATGTYGTLSNGATFTLTVN